MRLSKAVSYTHLYRRRSGDQPGAQLPDVPVRQSGRLHRGGGTDGA